ncbi:hypothetical protein LZ198_12785 [Myxococcus sp. K15C18031901]|uniref:hypothetical protein n=1 Tax=Myxococcus dinghuensis TaxID=2906761 RepID=UPI0020A7AEAC|nr:hypothetical protein [Myxococcus dinghuensis]MCP3099743.1 hypothetical protein [Myxococcus dinghuensis]
MTTASRVTRRAVLGMLGTSLLGGLSACGLSGTGGRSIVFDMGLRTALAPDEADVGTFSTDTGWRVRLGSGWMVLGPIYLFENASPLQPQARERAWPRRLARALLPTAHAHDGDFFSGGTVLGEWDREVVFDLLADAGGTRVLGRSPGIAGRARSFSLLLQPPSRVLGSEAAPLGGHSVLLEGTASREDLRIPFRVALDFPPPVALQRVEFVPVEADLDDAGRFVVDLQPHRWFEGTHFDRLDLPAGGGTVDIPPEAQVHRALSVNVRRSTAFAGRWEP